MMRIVVIGAGRAGLALAVPWLDQGHAVVLAGTHRDEAVIEALETGGPHPALDRPAPAGLRCHSYLDLDGLLQSGPDLVVLAVRAAGLAFAAEHLRRAPSGLPVLVVGGGLLAGQGEILTPAAWLGRALAGTGSTVGSLGGPWRPVDLLERQDALALLTLPAGIRAQRLERALAGAAFHLRLVPDEIGTPAASALARMFAAGLIEIASRPAPGLPSGAPAMLTAQAVLETGRVIGLLGGRAETAAGPAGLGQLVLLGAGGQGRDAEPLEEGQEIALAIGPTIVGWCATGRISRDAIPLTRALIDALVDGQPLVLPWSRFHRPA